MTGAASRAGLLLTSLAFALSVALLFASRVREFADETDNLLGGLLLARGARLYLDYFSSHMPLPYYVAAVPALLGAARLEDFRPFTRTLLVLATLFIVWAFRHRLPPQLLLLWATLTVFAHRLQWGEMLTAGTCAAFGVLVAGLLFYTTPALRFSQRQMVLLSGAVFVAVQSELLALFPLVVLGASFLTLTLKLGVRLKEARRTSLAREMQPAARLLLVVAAPHLVVLLGLWLSGALGEFVYDVYQFNQTYYSQFLMNSSALGMLHDWEAQYRTYVALSLLQEPLGVQAGLVLANLVAAWVVWRERGLLTALTFYLFVALTHVRNESMYYLVSYFSLSLDLVWAWRQLRHARRVWTAAVPVLTLLVAANFVLQVGRTYDLSGKPARDAPEVAIVQALTEPGERIFVAPYDPYLYLATGRMPASTFSFYFPWQAIDPRSEGKILADLSSVRPPLIVFHADERVNGRWLPRDYGGRVLDFLNREYAPVDPSSPVLGDIFVRKDRLTDVQRRLAASPALRKTNP